MVLLVMIQSLLKTFGQLHKGRLGGNSSVDLVRNLPFADRKGRLFAAGDIHGEFHVLMAALHALEFDFDKDLLLLVGDIHDRGVNSPDCLELLQEPWLLSTIGNHEWMLLSVVTESGSINYKNQAALDTFIVNGGEWCLDRTDQERARWRSLILEHVPLYWMLERRDSHKVMVCHAEPASEYLPDVIAVKNRKIDTALLHDEQTIWGRNMLYNAARSYLSHDIKQQLLPPVEGVLFSMHGHSYVKKAAWVNNQLYLDTGTTLGNKLTLVDIDHVIPGMCNGIYAWSIAEEKLLECESMRLWPA
jgi:serine/threonine protein phosphatase 1